MGMNYNNKPLVKKMGKGKRIKTGLINKRQNTKGQCVKKKREKREGAQPNAEELSLAF